MDIFTYCKGIRLAPDFPVPIVNIVRKIQSPGMAMNVYRNLVKYLPKTRIKTNDNWEKVTKERFVDESSNHHFFRIDSNETVEKIRKIPPLKSYDAIVISDYNKGYLDTELIEHICNQHPLVFLDTKKILGSWAKSAFLIKINEFEYQRSAPFISSELRDKIICTLGSKGSRFRDQVFSAPAVDARDSSGAGDAFFAALVIDYLIHLNINSAIEVANLLASKVVTKRGVTII
jgi:D-beta-D-heptose 7-phosphate kinase/D-beta-D-heptose 1-phosphate adenosyltransferase